MKKISLSFLLLIATLCSFAQSEHVKFMGIPLNGSIQQFHQKLVAKGFTHNKVGSSMVSNGIRIYNGAFASEDAEIFVYYDEKTKIVYRAKAIISCSNDNLRETQFNDMKGLLDTKYGTSLRFKDTQYGHVSYTYTILSEKNEIIGLVGLYILNTDFSSHEYTIHVDYYDSANLQKHENRRLDDI